MYRDDKIWSKLIKNFVLNVVLKHNRLISVFIFVNMSSSSVVDMCSREEPLSFLLLRDFFLQAGCRSCQPTKGTEAINRFSIIKSMQAVKCRVIP